MRFTAIVILLLVAIPAFSETPSIPVAPQTQASVSLPKRSIVLQSPTFRLLDRRPQHSLYSSGLADARSSLCYTMNSIRVQRKSNQTDEVQRQSQQTCTSASVFKVKPAVPETR